MRGIRRVSVTAENLNEFGTGAVRERKEGKGDYSLLPPFAIHKLAQLMQSNAQRIGARNWEKGIPLSSYIDSGERHVNEYRMGMNDEYHLLRAAWNLMCAVDTIERVRAGLLSPELLDCGAYETYGLDETL
jgi:hypothetical protein